jgi:glycosyltransferase involved in cell wall biosynthesis
MLPTHEPDEKLCAALRSVLGQAPPRSDMQIAVIDDGSRLGLARSLVRCVDPTGRIDVLEHRERLGLSGNWNRAIALARGRLVHLLHQDDYVLPGFYAAMQRGFRRAPAIGMAFCRSRIVDGHDRSIKLSSRLRWLPGVMADWLPTVTERQRIQTPSVVVARSTYEAIGGYRSDLCQALDWEMWVRIAARYPVWYEPGILSVYRRHPHNESARLISTGAAWPDIARTIEINALSLPEGIRGRIVAASARWHAASALRTAERLLADGSIDQAATTTAHIPRMLRLLGHDGEASGLHRRLAALHERLGHAARRAA